MGCGGVTLPLLRPLKGEFWRGASRDCDLCWLALELKVEALVVPLDLLSSARNGFCFCNFCWYCLNTMAWPPKSFRSNKGPTLQNSLQACDCLASLSASSLRRSIRFAHARNVGKLRVVSSAPISCVSSRTSISLVGWSMLDSDDERARIVSEIYSSLAKAMTCALKSVSQSLRMVTGTMRDLLLVTGRAPKSLRWVSSRSSGAISKGHCTVA